MGVGEQTLDFRIVALGLAHQQRGRLAVERVRRVGIPQELGQEDLENVDHIKHRRPGLVDHVQADGTGPIVPALLVHPPVSQAEPELCPLTARRYLGGRCG